MAYDLLDGVKVVELSMYAFAPSSAAVLADWGADVVKVVPPHVADPMKGTPIARLPERDASVEFMWEIMNRGKRCVALDVSMGEGQTVVHDLVATADVFVTNLLPDARRRLRVDVDDLLAANARAAARWSTCRCCRRGYGCSPPASSPRSSTGSTPSRASVTPTHPTPW